ncbi:MAG: helix-turn-helix domain-containing protein [Clostridiales bacterium]|nr:helix-turn-helix domain-containing protein [Clostridiales bacterium]
MEIFSKRLNELIQDYKITRYKLAKELNVNKQTVAFWCDGVNEPKISYLKAIALFFGVSCDYLVGMENADGSTAYNSK